MEQSCFEVVVPHAIVDGSEYTLLTERELAERRVSADELRRQADDKSEQMLRETKLLPAEGNVTEEQLAEARRQFYEVTARQHQWDLENHRVIAEAAAAGDLEIVRATYVLRTPRTEDMARAREAAAVERGGIDTDLYYAALARNLFVSTTRADIPAVDGATELSPPVLRALGMEAHTRGNLGTSELAFVLRSRKLSSMGSPSSSAT